MDPRQVIIRPVVSEKSYALMADGKYTFRVHERAHKTQIAQAVEEIFGVNVRAVRTSKVRVEAEAPRPARRAPAAPGRRRSSSSPPASGSSCSRARRWRARAMANRKTKPTSPGRRFGTYQMREELDRRRARQEADRRARSAPAAATPTAASPRRHRGGGAKRRYREIDFKRTKDGVPAKVATIEYDPNRSAYIALLNYADGEKRYILAPQGLAVGAEVVSGEGADITPGQRAAARARSRPAPSSTTSS